MEILFKHAIVDRDICTLSTIWPLKYPQGNPYHCNMAVHCHLAPGPLTLGVELLGCLSPVLDPIFTLFTHTESRLIKGDLEVARYLH